MKNVIVTGAARGIGYHIAKAFGAKGYRVFALDVLEGNFSEENIYFMKTDLGEEEQIQSTFQAIQSKFGAIHILINNGAISSFCKNILEVSSAEFDRVLGVNLRGSFLCCKEFVKANAGESYGRIINIASTRYHQNEADWEAYGASKGGLVSLTNTLCVSLAETPITVNAISPGWIAVNDYDQLTAFDHQQHPSGRVGKPADIVNVCLFLADEANDFMNGANIIVDGGMTKKMIYLESDNC